MNPQPESTVVLADDHAIVREGLAALCASHGLRILGQCSDGRAALEMISRLQPHYAILDHCMPGMTGLDVIRKLRSYGCKAKLIMLTISREERTVIEALRAGADAYLLKDGPFRHLLDAINCIRDGGVYVTPLLRAAALSTEVEKAHPDDLRHSLSPREAEIFSYVVKGLRAKEIADLLHLSPKTVDTYRASLMRKLNVHDLAGLMRFDDDEIDGSSALAPINPRPATRRPRAAAADPFEELTSLETGEPQRPGKLLQWPSNGPEKAPLKRPWGPSSSSYSGSS